MSKTNVQIKPRWEVEPQEKMRVTVTIPDEVRDLFQWYLNYDSSFRGNAAGLAAEMIRAGLETKYHEGLANVPSMADEEFKALSTHQNQALKKATEE